jgi:hypothetical protein
MTKSQLAGGDQTLDGLKLIGEAALNVLEPRGRCEITAVEEERLYVRHKQIGFPEKIARFRQL